MDIRVCVRAWCWAPSAWGGLSDAIAVDAKFDYSEIPHFPRSTTVGHSGCLVCGRVDGLPIVAMEGRFHAYEGYTYQQITFPCA